MRHIASGIVFAALVVLFGAPHARAWDDKECTKATLKGGFGYTGTGALLAAYVGPTDAHRRYRDAQRQRRHLAGYRRGHLHR